MKRAIALLELVFAIVLMGLSLAAFGPVLTKVSANSDRANIGEYVNLLSYYATLKSSLPYSAQNICKTDVRNNSRLAQVCAPKDAIVNVKYLGDYSISSQNRASGMSGPSTAMGFSSGANAGAKISWFDSYVRKHDVVFSDIFEDIDPESTIGATCSSGVANLADTSRTMSKCILTVSLGKNSPKTLQLETYYGDMGRTESLYHRYLIKILNSDSRIDTSIQNDLERYANQKEKYN